MEMRLFIALLVSVLLSCPYVETSRDTCSISEIFVVQRLCAKRSRLNEVKKTEDDSIYILYDVNTVEGFNLRRDVYIRMAVFVKHLRRDPLFKNAKLVLPPYPRLYHWKTNNLQQYRLFWNRFFDLDSLRLYTEVLDFWEFVEQVKRKTRSGILFIDHAYKLKQFEDMFENGVFVDKFEYLECEKSQEYPQWYFTYRNITSESFSCLKYQGSAFLLKNVLRKFIQSVNRNPKIVLFLNAEVVLHEYWGNEEFWKARRSMRFNKSLVEIAKEYRKMKFGSTKEIEMVQRPTDWRREKPYRAARGGDYLCAHLRRADFLYGREKVIPTLRSAASQIKRKLTLLGLEKVFISSDCNGYEYENLKSYLGRYKAYRFTPESQKQRNEILDGGIAIIDQIICSHARYFIGTHESTFTYRIFEEREILGFQKETTFNTFCRNEDLTNCEKTSVWPIVY